MKVWLILSLLSLGWCSENVDQQETEILNDGYAFLVNIKIPKINSNEYELNTTEVPFISHADVSDDHIHLYGIPLQDPKDFPPIHVTMPSPSGENYTVAIQFHMREWDVTEEGCGLYKAAVVEIAEYPFYETNRTKLFDTMKNISERMRYPMKLMKLQRSQNQDKDLHLHFMAPENCSDEIFNIDFWKAINRIGEEMQNNTFKVEGIEFGDFWVTDEFRENLRYAPRQFDSNDEKPREMDFPEISIDGRASETVATVSSTAATIIDPKTPNTPSSTTIEPSTQSTKALTTTSTAAPTTTSTAAPTSTSPAPPSTMSIPVSSEVPLPVVTEAAIEEDHESARALDGDPSETVAKEDSGASIAMPLFAVIVLLAIASAVAVFTIVRAKNVHRKTFVIGNASPEEINDIVVLGSDDGFN